MSSRHVYSGHKRSHVHASKRARLADDPRGGQAERSSHDSRSHRGYQIVQNERHQKGGGRRYSRESGAETQSGGSPRGPSGFSDRDTQSTRPASPSRSDSLGISGNAIAAENRKEDGEADASPPVRAGSADKQCAEEREQQLRQAVLAKFRQSELGVEARDAVEHPVSSLPESVPLHVGQSSRIIGDDPDAERATIGDNEPHHPPTRRQGRAWSSDTSSEGDGDEDEARFDGSPTLLPDSESAAEGSVPAEGDVLPRELAWLLPCRKINDCYDRMNTIDEGTYGIVFRVKDKETGEILALKKIKLHEQLVHKEGFPITSLREINLLLQLRHPNVVRVKEVVMDGMENVFMAMEYTDHDLKSVMEAMKHPFTQSEVKYLMQQLLSGIAYLHENWVIHRDIKASNLLLDSHGVLKLCDFGLARFYGDPIRPYTPYNQVVTLWYRAPELLLGCKKYSTAIDMWSVGCIFAEMLCKQPLLPAKNEIEQFDRIMTLIGIPREKEWPELPKLPNPYKIRYNRPPGHSDYKSLEELFPTVMGFNPDRTYLTTQGRDLLIRMLQYDPSQRISAQEALEHDYFKEHPLPAPLATIHTIPSTHEESRAHRSNKTPEAKDRLLQMLKEDEARYKRNSQRDRHYKAQ